jgi:hypothetical protein
MAMSSNVTPVTFTVPEGFAQIGSPFTHDVGFGVQMFGKYAFNEPASYTIGASTTNAGAVRVIAFSGVAAVAALDRIAIQYNADATSIALPNIPTTAANGYAVYAIGLPSLSATLGTVPATWDDRGSASSPGRMAWLEKAVTGSGTVTGPSWALAAGVSAASAAIGVHLTPTTVVPYNFGVPRLAGNNWNGQSMRAVPGDWLGVQSQTFVWKRDGVAI